MKNLKIEQNGTEIVIRINAGIDGEPPRAAGTKGDWDKGRKGWLIASTGGNEPLPQRVNGRQMVLGVNLFTKDGPLESEEQEESSRKRRA